MWAGGRERQVIKKVLTRLRHIQRKVGWREFVFFLLRRGIKECIQLVADPKGARNRWQTRMTGTGLTDAYRFVLNNAVPANPDAEVPARTVNWVIPDFGVGSGGHLNIFRFIRALELQGYKCAVVIDGKTHFSTPEQARASIRQHFFLLDASVHFGVHDMPPAEFVFATSWTTAYSVRACANVPFKCYFVQDFEPYFYAHGSEYVFAENTYRFGFIGVTAGKWLAEKLRAEYGMKTFPLGFSYDKQLYASPDRAREKSDKRRVFFYARPPTVRRAFELGTLVLGEVHRRHPEVEIVMAGWDLGGYDIPFPYVDRGVMALADLPELFQRCDVALVLSYSNASLLPLELMACGCTVVSNQGPYVEWLLDDTVARLVPSDVREMADVICHLIADTSAREALKEAGLRFARTTDWENEGLRFVGYLEEMRTMKTTVEMEQA